MTDTRINFLGLPLDAGLTIDDVCGLLKKKANLTVTFINPGAWATAKADAAYARALGQMSLVLADGIAVAAGCSKLTGEKCERISFDMTSLADPFFKKLEEKKMSVMLIGGRPGVADTVAVKLQTSYPALNVSDTTHGFGDIDAKVELVKAKNPDCVIVAMGAPRQEALLAALSEAKYKGFAITCGGFFDQYTAVDGEQYYPAWIDRLHLRFAYRLFKEPGRLWRRYLIDYQLFVWLALKFVVMTAIERARGLVLRATAKRT